MMQWVQNDGLAVVAAMLILFVNFDGSTASMVAATTKTRAQASLGRVYVDRIIGGSPVSIDTVPYTVSLRYSGSHACGGCVIGRRCVVTAAHCCQVKASVMTINAGSTFSNVEEQVRSVVKVTVHPGYNTTSPSWIDNDYDVCVLTLSADLDLSQPSCRMVALADSSTVTKAGDKSNVSGWGVTASGGTSVSTPLMSVVVTIVDQLVCKSNYAKKNEITDRMICAADAGKDSCQGDSGGPMVDVNGTLIGIVSFGYGCGDINYPGVYCRVSAITAWLTEQCASAKTSTVVTAARKKQSRML